MRSSTSRTSKNGYVERFKRIADAAQAAQDGDFTSAATAGYTNTEIASLPDGGVDVNTVEQKVPGRNYKQVDTCAGEFRAETPYYYSARLPEFQSGPLLGDEAAGELRVEKEAESVVVVGGGPIRIGQGVEFDYCSVHAVQALRDLGIEAHVVNNNPETVSTDYDTSDGLFFDPISAEEVADVVEATGADGVMVQFGGQTSVNIGDPLEAEIDRRGLDCSVLGTTVEAMDLAEDRDRFNELMDDLGIAQPEGGTATSENEHSNSPTRSATLSSSARATCSAAARCALSTTTPSWNTTSRRQFASRRTNRSSSMNSLATRSNSMWTPLPTERTC